MTLLYKLYDWRSAGGSRLLNYNTTFLIGSLIAAMTDSQAAHIRWIEGWA